MLCSSQPLATHVSTTTLQLRFVLSRGCSLCVRMLGLFANVRPVATFDCLLHKSPLKDELLKGADFVVIRELTGGMYFGEKYQDNDKAYDTDIYTRPEIERILKVAFEFAMKRNKHLTVVDKAKRIGIFSSLASDCQGDGATVS